MHALAQLQQGHCSIQITRKRVSIALHLIANISIFITLKRTIISNLPHENEIYNS